MRRLGGDASPNHLVAPRGVKFALLSFRLGAPTFYVVLRRHDLRLDPYLHYILAKYPKVPTTAKEYSW